MLTARGAHQCSGDLQHRLYKHVLLGDDPQAHSFWLFQLPEKPLQRL